MSVELINIVDEIVRKHRASRRCRSMGSKAHLTPLKESPSEGSTRAKAP